VAHKYNAVLIQKFTNISTLSTDRNRNVRSKTANNSTEAQN